MVILHPARLCIELQGRGAREHPGTELLPEILQCFDLLRCGAHSLVALETEETAIGLRLAVIVQNGLAARVKPRLVRVAKQDLSRADHVLIGGVVGRDLSVELSCLERALPERLFTLAN